MKFYLDETGWTRKGGPLLLQIGLATFGILALELALIRWTSSQIRIFAYFNNLVLIAAFLGMGLGVALGRKYGGLVHWTLPMLCLVSIPLAFSENLGVVRLAFPDQAISLWGGDQLAGSPSQYLFSLLIFLLIFSAITLVFIFAGAAVGYLFSKTGTLRAYTSDLLGSLLGILIFTLITFWNSGPPVWLLIGSLPFLWLSRKLISAISFAAILILAGYSVKGAIYSPYNRIDIRTVDFGQRLEVNRDFHQFIYDLSDPKIASPELPEKRRAFLRFLKDVYDLPFQLNRSRETALIVGAGTGNDIQAALRNGYKKIYSVDIDGKIMELGKQLHPEKPYEDPRVIPVVNDARAFFEQYEGPPFDVICYGLVDSHAMFSSMSTLRLDNYVYTEEGIKSAWKHVADNGHLSISFSLYAGDWMGDRLYWTIAKATNIRPFAVYSGMHYSATFIVSPDRNTVAYDRLKKYQPLIPRADMDQVRTPSDDWPFLYLRPGAFPHGYVLVLSMIIGLSVVSAMLVFRKSITAEFDPTLFLMGAAFLLIETRGVTSLSLLFGSTWIVNSAIFAGVLIMVLLANLYVQRVRLKSPLPFFLLLIISLIFLWSVDLSRLNHLPILIRGLLGGLLHALPIAFAGVIVSFLLSESTNSSAALGSNLLGAVVGGCVEYLSMYLGLKTMVLLALVFYLLAMFFWQRRFVTQPVAITGSS